MKGVEYRATMTEAQFQAQVIALAEQFKWRWFHLPDTELKKYAKAGFPDLVLVRKGVLIFAELKKETGAISGAQMMWIDDLRDAGAQIYVWHPSDLPEIERMLR